MSQSTLISIVPFPILEEKPGIYPGRFTVPASKDLMPEVTIIGDSVYHVEVDEVRTITVKCPSDDVALAVVNDYVASNLCYDENKNAAPGFFWLPGALKSIDIVTKESDLLQRMKERQFNWFKALVSLADDDWERTRQHKFISDMARYAAKSMNLSRPWIINASLTDSQVSMIKCIACQSVVPSTAIVCSSCRCILKPEEYKKLTFAEVK